MTDDCEKDEYAHGQIINTIGNSRDNHGPNILYRYL